MEQKEFDRWEQFESFIKDIEKDRETAVKSLPGRVSPFLYRGHGDHSWSLQTTLERSNDRPWSFSEYFYLISKARPQIETFTNRHWNMGEYPELDAWASKYDNLLIREHPGYDYLVYLRHHGFPSPLLDWSRSPYVAAFFAFNQPVSNKVALYIYQEYTGNSKATSSSDSMIKSFGPYVSAHSRHFLQQSEYTIGAQYIDDKWWYRPHEDVFSTLLDEQDRLWKIILPASERLNVLKSLDCYNLNAFSLFQTEEALLNTIAVREMELCEPNHC